MLKKEVFGFALLFIIICFAQSCKQGCTDRNAYNYSSSAKENDGSCLYCDSSSVDNGFEFISIEDVNSQSPYAFQYVLRAVVTSGEVQLNGNGCALLGYSNGNNACNKYSNNLQLINLTNRTITLSGLLDVTYSSQFNGQSQTITYQFNSAQVAAFDTLKIGNISGVCVAGNNAFFELGMNTNGNTITYN